MSGEPVSFPLDLKKVISARALLVLLVAFRTEIEPCVCLLYICSSAELLDCSVFSDISSISVKPVGHVTAAATRMDICFWGLLLRQCFSPSLGQDK